MRLKSFGIGVEEAEKDGGDFKEYSVGIHGQEGNSVGRDADVQRIFGEDGNKARA